MVQGAFQIVDYFNYEMPLYGALPDGQPFTRGALRYPTPGLSNLSPRNTSIRRSEDYVYLTFDVLPGHGYRLEYQDGLNQSAWNVLFGNFVAGELTWTYVDTPVEGQRFYRLALIP